MLNLDMVGRLRGNHLNVESGRMDRSTRATFDSATKAADIRPDFVRSEGRSDHDSFEARDIAAAELYTGTHRDYHTASDVAGRINVERLARVVDFAELVARRIADR